MIDLPSDTLSHLMDGASLAGEGHGCPALVSFFSVQERGAIRVSGVQPLARPRLISEQTEQLPKAYAICGPICNRKNTKLHEFDDAMQNLRKIYVT